MLGDTRAAHPVYLSGIRRALVLTEEEHNRLWADFELDLGCYRVPDYPPSL